MSSPPWGCFLGEDVEVKDEIEMKDRVTRGMVFVGGVSDRVTEV